MRPAPGTPAVNRSSHSRRSTECKGSPRRRPLLRCWRRGTIAVLARSRTKPPRSAAGTPAKSSSAPPVPPASPPRPSEARILAAARSTAIAASAPAGDAMRRNPPSPGESCRHRSTGTAPASPGAPSRSSPAERTSACPPLRPVHSNRRSCSRRSPPVAKDLSGS